MLTFYKKERGNTSLLHYLTVIWQPVPQVVSGVEQSTFEQLLEHGEKQVVSVIQGIEQAIKVEKIDVTP